MAERRLLVIGSQCAKLNPLSFLPEVAVRLHELLVQPGPGGCIGVALDGGHPPGLLIDPTVDQAKDAIEAAIDGAARDRAALILVYIGHGEFPDEMAGDFYLMPTNVKKLTQRGAIQFVEFLNDCLKPPQPPVDLIVLLDACHAGVGAWKGMERVATARRGDLRFELLTATDDQATANAPLARAWIELLEYGDYAFPASLRGSDLHARLRARHHPSQHVAFGGTEGSLHLGRNPARDPGEVFWKESPGRESILAQTAYFQPTRELTRLVEASRAHPVVVATGETGCGKSTLASALARPERTHENVPVGFIQAIALLDRTSNRGSVADDLEAQLRHSVPGFDEAAAALRRAQLEPIRRQVIEPLRNLADPPEVRIVLDALNQADPVLRSALREAFAERPDHVRLIVTTQPHVSDCPEGVELPLNRPGRVELDDYLKARGVPDAARGAILDRAGGQWLIARLLADAVLKDPEIDLATLPKTVLGAYKTRLDQIDAWEDPVLAVLGPLAVAGSGPVLPFRLLAHASQALGGPADEEGVRGILARLQGLVARRDANTPDEHVGLFHPTLADFLLGDSDEAARFSIDANGSHRALAEAIAALVPMDSHDRYDPLHRYAFRQEADHLWSLGEIDRTLECVTSRSANDPRENLDRASRWLRRFREHFRADESHPSLLILRGFAAKYTGDSGDAREALRLSRELLPDQSRVLGADHPDTLRTRSNVASWSGEVGDAREALRLFRELLPDYTRVLGADHPDTLNTLGFVGYYAIQNGDLAEGCRCFREGLARCEARFGPDHALAERFREAIRQYGCPDTGS